MQDATLRLEAGKRLLATSAFLASEQITDVEVDTGRSFVTISDLVLGLITNRITSRVDNHMGTVGDTTANRPWVPGCHAVGHTTDRGSC